MAAVETLIADHLDLWTAALKRKSTAGRGSSSRVELYGIKKLRELILELAVRGLLVPQDPNDEPASELLKRIAVEKARLVKVGKIKKESPLPPIAAEEMPFDLPNAWCWARLGEVTNYGFSDKAEPADVNEHTWVLELEDVEKETSRLVRKVRFFEREFKSSKNIFKAGDVIYGKLRPYLDKVLVADEDGVCTTEMIPARAYSVVTSEFLRLSMKSPQFIKYANNATHGMNLPRVGTDKARLALIPICSEATQHRIVAKVDELMALCDQLELETDASLGVHQTLVETLLSTLASAADHAQFASAWQRIAGHFDTLFTTEESIDQLKQTILQLAVMGKLVSQAPTDEPASELLKKIAVEKAKLIKEGKIKKDKPLPPITAGEAPFAIPAGWALARLADVINVLNGRAYKKHEMLSEGTPILRVGNLFTSNEWYFSDLELEPEKYIDDGDLIYAWSASFGPFIWQGGKVIYHYHIWKMEFFSKADVDKFYFRHYLQAISASIKASGNGIAMIHMTKERMEKLVLPIPPIEEQHRIVAKVDELMALCDQLKSRLSDAQTTQLHLADALVERAIC